MKCGGFCQKQLKRVFQLLVRLIAWIGAQFLIKCQFAKLFSNIYEDDKLLASMMAVI